MVYLLDVNILIAFADPQHVFHQRTRNWFFDGGTRLAWATCPLVQNAFIRIVGAPSYPDFAGGTKGAATVLKAILAQPGHQFWPDDFSLCDYPDLPPSKHLTDFYLLTLAVRKKAQFATMDQRIDPQMVAGGAQALLLVP